MRIASFILALLLAAPASFMVVPAWALEVSGVIVTPAGGPYVAFKDVNVRAKPTVKSKKVGSIKKGTRMRLLGYPEGKAEYKDWAAVEIEGLGQGFIITSVLLPLLDGVLAEPIMNPDYSAKAGPHCQFVIRYEGSTPVEGDAFNTADYDVPILCTDGEERARFSAFMFLTEAPYRMTPGGDFQVGIDVLRIESNMDAHMSYTFLYRPKDGVVVLDSVSHTEFVDSKAESERQVKDVPALLQAVVEMTVESWNDTAWERIFANQD